MHDQSSIAGDGCFVAFKAAGDAISFGADVLPCVSFLACEAVRLFPTLLNPFLELASWSLSECLGQQEALRHAELERARFRSFKFDSVDELLHAGPPSTRLSV